MYTPNRNRMPVIYRADELGIYKGIQRERKRSNQKGMGLIKRIYKEYKELSKGEGSELLLITTTIVLLWILLTHTI